MFVNFAWLGAACWTDQLGLFQYWSLPVVRLILNWILSAVALLVVSRLINGFHIDTFATALVAALIFGLLNATVGLLLKFVTLPITILTLGIFLLVINALMLELASSLVWGFHIRSFAAAFWGALVLAVL